MNDKSLEVPVRRRSWRRWLQFRLRTFFILVAMLAVAMGVWFHYVKPFRDQAEAAEALRGLNATVGTETGVPEWISRIFGSEHFQNVVSVNLEHLRFQPDDLAVFQQLPHLDRVYLARSSIDNDGLSHLRGLGKLQRVSLWGTKVTGEGIAHLQHLPALEVLDLQRTTLTEDVLDELEGLTSLKRLLFDFPLTDKGLARLAAFPNLRRHHYVRMQCRNVTGRGLHALTWFPEVEHLTITDSKLTAADLAYLSGLPVLQNLTLQQTAVDVAGLQTLAKLPCQQLHVRVSNIRFRDLAAAYGDRVRFVVARQSMATLASSKELQYTNVGIAQRQDLAPTRVIFEGRITSEDLEALADLPVLFGVSLYSDMRIDEIAPGLQKQRDLEGLSCNGPFSATTLENLGQLSGLKRLSLSGPSDNPADFAPLGQLIHLETLALRRTNLTDEHLAFLAGLTELRMLHLGSNGGIRGSGLAAITGMSKLEELQLNNCGSLGDEGMPHIGSLVNLQRLNLQYTKVGDAGIKHLYGLQFLTDVDLTKTRVTRQGQTALQMYLTRSQRP